MLCLAFPSYIYIIILNCFSGIKQVEVTGEKSLEPMDSKKSKKMSRKKSTDNSELNIACRNLGNADFEGWLMKKGSWFKFCFVFLFKNMCLVDFFKILVKHFTFYINGCTYFKVNIFLLILVMLFCKCFSWWSWFSTS